MRIVFCLVAICCFFGCVSTTQNNKNTNPTSIVNNSPEYPVGPPSQPNCREANYYYLVTQNLLYSEKVRHIEVYLAPEAFNEENLRILFACLGRENPYPHHLIAELETDWSRVHIPDGRPGSGASSMPPDPHENDYLRAVYFRRPGRGDRTGGREYFRYSPAVNMDEFYFKTVRMKE